MYITKKLLSALLVVSSGVVFLGCDDEAVEEINPYGYVSFSHMAPATPTTPAARPVNIFIDGTRKNIPATLSYSGTVTGTYVGLEEGSRAVSVQDATTPTPVTEYFGGALNITKGQSYSVFVYDTLNAGKLRALVLTTDRSPATSGNFKVRFLHLIPNGPAVDLWAFRSATDSVRIAQSVTYVGPTPNAASLSTFSNIPAGTFTALRVRLAGTNTNVVSTSGVTLVPGKAYTIIARGFVGGAGANAPNATVLLQNP